VVIFLGELLDLSGNVPHFKNAVYHEFTKFLKWDQKRWATIVYKLHSKQQQHCWCPKHSLISMGVGKVYSRGDYSGLFQGVAKRIVFKGVYSGEISIYQLETKRKTFFY